MFRLRTSITLLLTLAALITAIAVRVAFAQAPVPPISVVDASGQINWWLLAGVVGTVLVTNVGMVLLKKLYPEWNKKAWAPPTLGLIVALLGAMASGQIYSAQTLVAWILAGVGSGAAASSVRDVVAGK